MKQFLRKWLPPLPLILPACLSGLLLTGAFPPFALGGLSFIALVPLLAALHKKRWSRGEGFRAGFLLGLVFFFTLLWWIAKLLPWANVTIPWLMTPALIIAVLYLSLYPAFFCLLLVTLGQGRRLAGFFLVPALWVLLELVRSRGEMGFSWGAIGYGLSRHVNFIQTVPWIGLFGLGFVLVVINYIFSLSLGARSRLQRTVPMAVGVVLVAALGLQGWFVTSSYREPENGEKVTLAVVQPNVSLKVKWEPEFRDSTFSLIERLSRVAASAGPDMIIFSETTAPVYIHHEEGVMERMVNLVEEIEIPIYVGFLDARYDGPNGELNIYNSSGVFTPGGKLLKYDKSHLLPFGESLPLSWKFRFIQKINFGQANFQPGRAAPPVRSGAGSFGSLICFESIFPELSRRYVQDGAEYLVNITNDGWFGSTPGPHQHAEMCILRSVETRRYLVRSANSGVSMVVDPLGRIVSELEMDREGMLIEKIERLKGQTFYVRAGEWPVLIVSLLFCIIGVVLARVGRP
jgi:apolipoprotein N-acyltransferase